MRKFPRAIVFMLFFFLMAVLVAIRLSFVSLDSKKLRVVTKNSPTTFYYDRYDAKSGFEYELVKEFAQATGRKLELILATHVDTMITKIEKREVDLVAAGISLTKERLDKGWRFGPVYARTKEHIVCRRGIRLKAGGSRNSQLKLLVVAGSSYEESLWSKGFDEKNWQSLDTNTEELLGSVENKEADCTVSDVHIFRNQVRFSENLVLRQAISEERQLAWVVDPDNKHLNDDLERFNYDLVSSGRLEALYEKYYGHTDKRFNRFDSMAFQRNKRERLSKYIELFQAAAQKYDIPWELVAAISYQESHWNPEAVSPTGVRGMMMLTRDTAKLMGVDRLKLKESIDGGVRYFLMLMKRLPKSIKPPDRTWVALASYNVGIGHIYDVRQLIRENRGKPDSWKEIKFYLPYLSKEEVYRKLRYGYARGWEPVKYVQRIRTYYEILKKMDADKIKALKTED